MSRNDTVRWHVRPDHSASSDPDIWANINTILPRRTLQPDRDVALREGVMSHPAQQLDAVAAHEVAPDGDQPHLTLLPDEAIVAELGAWMMDD